MIVIKDIIRFKIISEDVFVKKDEKFVQLEFLKGEIENVKEYEINELTYLDKPIIKIYNIQKEIILISEENSEIKRISLVEDFHIFSISVERLDENSIIIQGILINNQLNEGVAACKYELNFKNYELILGNFQTVTNWRNEILNGDDIDLDELFSS